MFSELVDVEIASAAAGDILIFNPSNLPQSRTISGDLALDDLGVATITSAAIGNAEIAPAAGIAASKIAGGTFDADTYSFSGSTIADLGTVSVADINGGTIGGVTFDGDSTAAADLTFIDDAAALFGTSGDASIKYDGSNLVVNPRVVGSGDVVVPSGNLSVPAGQLVLNAAGDSHISVPTKNRFVFQQGGGGTLEFKGDNIGASSRLEIVSPSTAGAARVMLSTPAFHQQEMSFEFREGAGDGTPGNGSYLFGYDANGDRFRIFSRNIDGSGTQDNVLILPDNTSDVVLPQSNSRLLINSTSNPHMSIGMTVNQGANDDEILSLRSTDINLAPGYSVDGHESNTFGALQKADPDLGGLEITGLAETAGTTSGNVKIAGFGGIADPTKSISGVGLVNVETAGISGVGTLADVGTNGNIFSVRGQIGGVMSTAFIVDVEGDVWQAGNLAVASTAQSTSPFSGSIVTSGGIGVAKDVSVGGLLSVAATNQSVSPTTGSVVTAGGLGVGRNVNAGGSISLGSTALSSGDLGLTTVELQDIADSAPTTLISGLLGSSGDYNAFTLSLVVRRDDDATINQRDLYWITTQGTDITITPLALEFGLGGGVAYGLSILGTDLVITQFEGGLNLVDVVAGVSGLRTVAP